MRCEVTLALWRAILRALLSLELNMNARLDELEAKLTLAEDVLESLNMTVFRQQQQIDLLQQQLHQMTLQLQSNGPSEARRLEDEIPPHW